MAQLDVFIAETGDAWAKNAIQIMTAGFQAANNGQKAFVCPICGGIAKCWKSEVNGHRGVECPNCELGAQE